MTVIEIEENDHTNRTIALFHSSGFSIEEMVNEACTSFLNDVYSKIYNIYIPKETEVKEPNFSLTLRQFLTIPHPSILEIVECDGVSKGYFRMSMKELKDYKYLDCNVIAISGSEKQHGVAVYIDISGKG